MLKKEIRILGIDDSPFDKFKKGKVLVIGTVCRGGDWVDGIMSTYADVDGSNSTSEIIKMVKRSRFRSQLRAVFLDGIAVGGFNVIDVKRLSKSLGIPVIVVIRDMPDIGKITETLKNLGYTNQLKLIKKAGPVQQIGKIYVQLTNISLEEAKELLEIACTRSFLPEAVRISHLIAAGIVKGESKGRA